MTQPFSITGRMSFFGGPRDTGVAPGENLALYDPWDVAHAPPGMFLPTQPPGSTGTARRLNPAFPYLAMRWAYSDDKKSVLLHDGRGRPLGVCLPVTTPHEWLKANTVLVSNPRRPDLKPQPAHPADWGPNSETFRVADLSPFFAEALDLQTNDLVTVTFPQ